MFRNVMFLALLGFAAQLWAVPEKAEAQYPETYDLVGLQNGQVVRRFTTEFTSVQQAKDYACTKGGGYSLYQVYHNGQLVATFNPCAGGASGGGGSSGGGVGGGGSSGGSSGSSSQCWRFTWSKGGQSGYASGGTTVASVTAEVRHLQSLGYTITYAEDRCGNGGRINFTQPAPPPPPPAITGYQIRYFFPGGSVQTINVCSGLIANQLVTQIVNRLVLQYHKSSTEVHRYYAVQSMTWPGNQYQCVGGYVRSR